MRPCINPFLYEENETQWASFLWKSDKKMEMSHSVQPYKPTSQRMVMHRGGKNQSQQELSSINMVFSISGIAAFQTEVSGTAQ